jgi:hypothetical protein
MLPAFHIFKWKRVTSSNNALSYTTVVLSLFDILNLLIDVLDIISLRISLFRRCNLYTQIVIPKAITATTTPIICQKVSWKKSIFVSPLSK